ncbi:MAG: transcription antitermination factor NusB [Bacilli bacterium]
MNRRNSRIIAMMSLYTKDVNPESTLDEVLSIAIEDDYIEYDKEFLKEIYDGVLANQSDIDYYLSICLKNYTLDRISYIDRALLRIGSYELIYTTTPKNIVINEIVDISKEYSEIDDYKTSKFNNAVLQSIADKKYETILNVKR